MKPAERALLLDTPLSTKLCIDTLYGRTGTDHDAPLPDPRGPDEDALSRCPVVDIDLRARVTWSRISAWEHSDVFKRFGRPLEIGAGPCHWAQKAQADQHFGFGCAEAI